MNDIVASVNAMIERYVTSVGLDKNKCYDSMKNSWNWRIGSASIQVYVQAVPLSSGAIRYYLRIFSPLMEIPTYNETYFYRYLLELNDSKLGVKLSVLGNWVYATYERDVVGMDYDELSTCIADLEWWADTLDDQLKQKFSAPPAGERPTDF
jgi:hypothetical protein